MELLDSGRDGGVAKKNNDTGHMDGELWGELPEHLHDIILAWLPLPSFFRLRCVCKKWNNMIESRTFLSIYARVPSHGPFFLMFADPFRQKFAAYDPTFNTWHLLPLSFCLSCPFSESFLVLAAAGGLLCVAGTGSGSNCRSLFVSNPMTRSQRKLPPMIHMNSPYVVGMVMNPHQNTYQILVAQDGDYLMSQVYDSKSNTWKMTHGLEKRVALIAGTAYIDGFLYSMTYGTTTGVLAYNVEQRQWHEVQVKMPLSLICPQLLGHRGQLLMVGGVEEFGILKCVHLWRLNVAGKEWVEVQRMPESLFNMLFKSAFFNLVNCRILEFERIISWAKKLQESFFGYHASTHILLLDCWQLKIVYDINTFCGWEESGRFMYTLSHYDLKADRGPCQEPKLPTPLLIVGQLGGEEALLHSTHNAYLND